MCGIIGSLGVADVTRQMVEGLKRLEYRGYDSAGLAVVADGGLRVHKIVGRVGQLEKSLPADFRGSVGIAHTRWATHGAPSETNAHPHIDGAGRTVVVDRSAQRARIPTCSGLRVGTAE